MEDIQHIPLTVTAFSAAQLEAQGAVSFAGYGTSAPNLSVGLGAGDRSIAARGIALRGILSANTGFYVDDTPVLDTLDPGGKSRGRYDGPWS